MENQGETCKENQGLKNFEDNKEYVYELVECKEALPIIQIIYPNLPPKIIEQDTIDFPKGCYVYAHGSVNDGIYFNRPENDIGYPDGFSRQVCKLKDPGT